MTSSVAPQRRGRGASLVEAAVAVALCLLLTALFVTPAWGATVTIQPPTDDSYLDQDSPGDTSLGAVTPILVQSQSFVNRRSIFKFSLAAIPSGSQITSATLQLYMSAAPSATRTYNVHRITRSWIESQVSWQQALTSVLWTTQGGDYVASPTASTTTGTVSGVWLSWDVTADVSAWYTGAAANNGLLVKDSVESSAIPYFANFTAKESGTTANHPRFVVTYTPPDLQVLSLTVTPSVVSGGTATVMMTVVNNGPVTVSGVTPSALTSSGTATRTLLSGPTPASVASLASGASTTFTWTYRITGSVGQTYAFSGSASANAGAVVAPTGTSNTGSVGSIAVSASPLEVVAGATNVQVAFTVNNGLASGTLNEVFITNPNTSIWQFTSAGWGANDTSGWTKSLAGADQFHFVAPGALQEIAAGASKTFTVTFSLIGAPPADTTYSFSVLVDGSATLTQTVLLTVRVPKLQVQSLTVDSSTVSGGTVTVVMTVKNTGSVSLSNVTPSALTTGGTATKMLTSGPTPASVASLAADTTATFQWVYTITGTVGQTYTFTGNATANGGSVSATSATSNTGSLVAYGLTVTPTSVTVGATGVQVRFAVTNNLTTGTVDQVTITNPNTAIFVSDATWGNNDTTGWTRSQPAANQYRFASPAVAQDIAANGGSKTFAVTFTSIGDPGVDTSYSFSVAIRQRGNATTTLTVSVTVTKYVLTLQSVSPASIAADGVATSRITVRLTRSGAAQASQNVTFTTTAGTVGGSTSTTALTNASGDAFVDLTSSVSTTTVTATVTMSFSGATSITTPVTFTGIVLAFTASPTTIPADNVTTSTLTATLTTGGSGISGRTINFSATSGTLSATSAVTNASGQATVTIRAAASKTGSTALVTAAYSGVTNLRSVTFTGITISEVAELNVTAGNAAATAYWAWPTTTGYREGVIILRRAAVTPAVPADGLTVNAGDTLADGSLVVAKVAVGGGSSVSQVGLTNGTKYYYRAVGYYAGTLYSTGTAVDATPTAGGVGQPLWSMNSSSAATSELIWNGGGGLYWGSTAGFSAVSDTAGTQPWSSLMTGTAVRTPPTMTVIDVLLDTYFVVGADTGNVYVVDSVTGGVLWQTASPLGDAITAAPALQYRVDSNAAFQAVHTTDAIFVATKNANPTTNKVYALNALTGAVKWTFNPGNMDQATGYLWADATTNRLWVVSKSNGGTQPSVWVLSTVDGTLQASFSLGDVATVGWSWDANQLYVSTSAGNLQAIDTGRVALAWSSALAVGSPVVGYVLEPFELRGKIFFSTQSGTVRGAQLNGAGLPPTVLWTTPVAGATTAAVIGAQGVLYVGAADGKVHKLRLTDGVDLAQVTAGDGTQTVTSIAVDTTTGTVWAATAGGKVYALPLP